MGRKVDTLCKALLFPPFAFTNDSLPSMVTMFSWLSFCFLFISMIKSFIAASWGWIFILFCCWRISHCCLITMEGPVCSILVSPGLYMLNTDVLVFFFPSRVTVAHLPSPCGSSPLVMIVEEIFPSVMIAVPLRRFFCELWLHWLVHFFSERISRVNYVVKRLLSIVVVVACSLRRL